MSLIRFGFKGMFFATLLNCIFWFNESKLLQIILGFPTPVFGKFGKFGKIKFNHLFFVISPRVKKIGRCK